MASFTDKQKIKCVLESDTQLLSTLKQLNFTKEFIKTNLNNICLTLFEGAQISPKHETCMRQTGADNSLAVGYMDDKERFILLKVFKKDTSGILIDIPVETERFHAEFGHYHKKHTPLDIIFYNHTNTNSYNVMTFEEFMFQLDMSKFTLMDCHVRTFKHKSTKYKRITFQAFDKKHSDSDLPSLVEHIFGNMLNGFTYIMSQDDWKKHKTEIMCNTIYCTSEFGKDTRFDLGGESHKKGEDE